MKYLCAIIAGEVSADVIARDIIFSTQKDIKWFGIGGPLMESQYFQSLFDWKYIKGFGIFDIILRIPFLITSAFILSNIILKKKPDLIVTVDTKGFNFFLIKILKIRSKKLSWKPKIMHIVAPTVWAWRPNRAKKVAGLIDKLICLFPKEPDYFNIYGLNAIFCGHPAVDRLSNINKDKSILLKKLGIKNNNIICALLPGSRSNEIRRLLPILINFVKEIEIKIKPSPIFVIPIASNQEKLITKILNNTRKIITIKNSELGDLLIKNADIAIVKSGTATLEYALCGVPSISIYRTGFLSAFIGRRIIDMSKIILPNWILDKHLIEFLFQENCNSKNLVKLFNNIHNNIEKKKFFDKSAKKLNLLLQSNNNTFKENIHKEIKELIINKSTSYKHLKI